MALNKVVYLGMSNEFLKNKKILFWIKGHWVKHQ